MRKILVIAIAFLVASCNASKEKSEELAAIDTLTTASGLQYYYLTKGEGKQVEKGSYLETILSLKVDDNVVWTSYESQDSLFSFIVGYDRVIKGFEEMALLMKEGDNVVAILPDSLAYGDAGAGDVIPPNATLIYDRFQMVSVGEPKVTLTDTLLATFEANGAESIIEVYNSIVNSDAKNSYHTELKHLTTFMNTLLQNNEFEGLEKVANDFENIAEGSAKQTFRHFEIIALENQNKIAAAIAEVKKYLEEEPDNEWLTSKLTELQGIDTEVEQP